MMKKAISLVLVLALLSASCPAVLADALVDALVLPKNLQTIEDEAFYGDTSLSVVHVPDGATEIGPRAFAHSGVSEIYIPDSVTSIADDAFEGMASDGLVIAAPYGSYAWQYALEKDIFWVDSVDHSDELIEMSDLLIEMAEGKEYSLDALPLFELVSTEGITDEAELAEINELNALLIEANQSLEAYNMCLSDFAAAIDEVIEYVDTTIEENEDGVVLSIGSMSYTIDTDLYDFITEDSVFSDVSLSAENQAISVTIDGKECYILLSDGGMTLTSGTPPRARANGDVEINQDWLDDSMRRQQQFESDIDFLNILCSGLSGALSGWQEQTDVTVKNLNYVKKFLDERILTWNTAGVMRNTNERLGTLEFQKTGGWLASKILAAVDVISTARQVNEHWKYLNEIVVPHGHPNDVDYMTWWGIQYSLELSKQIDYLRTLYTANAATSLASAVASFRSVSAAISSAAKKIWPPATVVIIVAGVVTRIALPPLEGTAYKRLLYIHSKLHTTVYGTVTSAKTGLPLKNVHVDGLIYETWTDENGEYTLYVYPYEDSSNRYLSYELDGYDTKLGKDVVVRRGEQVRVDIALEGGPDPDPDPDDPGPDDPDPDDPTQDGETDECTPIALPTLGGSLPGYTLLSKESFPWLGTYEMSGSYSWPENDSYYEDIADGYYYNSKDKTHWWYDGDTVRCMINKNGVYYCDIFRSGKAYHVKEYIYINGEYIFNIRMFDEENKEYYTEMEVMKIPSYYVSKTWVTQSWCDNVASIITDGANLSSLEYFHNLETLEINPVEDGQPATSKLVINNFSKLKKLTLNYGFQLDELVISNCPSLEALDVTGETMYIGLAPQSFGRINIVNCNSLKMLKLGRPYSIYVSDFWQYADTDYVEQHDDGTWTILVDYWLTINSLHISGCTALETLMCEDVQLTSLDVSGCVALKDLSCWNNQLTSLDVSGCVALEGLSCSGNQLTSLDASDCVALKDLSCWNNQLTSLDVSGCVALERLFCEDNLLTSLDVSSSPLLEYLSFPKELRVLDASGTSLTDFRWGGKLTSVDLSGCTALKFVELHGQLINLNVSDCSALEDIRCYGNQLTYLNVKGCSALEHLSCENNQLTSLDVSECVALKSLDCGNNQLTSLDVSECVALESLYCVNNQLSELDVTNIPNLYFALLAGGYAEIDNRRYYVLTDEDITIVKKTVDNNISSFPDPAFRAYISENIDMDQDGVLSEVEISNVRTIILQSTELVTLEGIQLFQNLNVLVVPNNKLAYLDVSRCTILKELICSGNSLQSLNVDGCSELIRLDCNGNRLMRLDVSGCIALEHFFCRNNQLTSLDVSGCVALKRLNCTANPLTSLDVSGCNELTILQCTGTLLASLNVSGCPNLTDLQCDDTVTIIGR